MSVTRRTFLVAVPAAGLALAMPRSPQAPGGSERAGAPLAAEASNAGAANAANAPPAPVVSFHLDQPYLDLTGFEKPYVPPAGMQSGASLAALTEEQVLSRFYGFI